MPSPTLKYVEIGGGNTTVVASRPAAAAVGDLLVVAILPNAPVANGYPQTVSVGGSGGPGPFTLTQSLRQTVYGTGTQIELWTKVLDAADISASSNIYFNAGGQARPSVVFVFAAGTFDPTTPFAGLTAGTDAAYTNEAATRAPSFNFTKMAYKIVIRANLIYSTNPGKVTSSPFIPIRDTYFWNNQHAIAVAGEAVNPGSTGVSPLFTNSGINNFQGINHLMFAVQEPNAAPAVIPNPPRQVGHETGGEQSSVINIVMPSDIQVGDVIIVNLMRAQSDNIAGALGNGFTEAVSRTFTSSITQTWNTYWKVATGSESGAIYPINLPATRLHTWQVATFRDGKAPTWGTVQETPSNSTNRVVAPAVTATSAHSRVLVLGGTFGIFGGGTAGFQPNYENLPDGITTQGGSNYLLSAGMGSRYMEASGSTGTAYIDFNHGFDSNTAMGAVQVVIPPGNLPPVTPTLTTPASAATLTTVQPLLSATVTDPDGGNLSSYFQVATDSGFTNVVSQGTGSTVASGTASTFRTAVLNSSTTYYWRAYASDGTYTSAYSAGRTFTTPAPITSTYTYTGAAQSFVVPAGVTSLTLECYGGQGGTRTGGATGGLGGYAKGTITVTPGETLQINVGNGGVYGSWNSSNPGFGGGGAAYGGNGGGASDVRRGGTALANRVMVGAGGGGAGNTGTEPNGGAGGAATGADGLPWNGNGFQGRGGTPTAGGAAGAQVNVFTSPSTAGASGVGGAGGWSDNFFGGAGGGGYFGGGGGGASEQNGAAGGGGGSNYVTGTATTTTRGLRSGTGQVVVSYANFSETANTVPTAPTLGTPAAGAALGLLGGATFTWTHNDADGNPQGSYSFRRTDSSNNITYWNGTDWVTGATYVQSASQSVVFPSGEWGIGTYTWAVSTTDNQGSASPYSTARTVISVGGLAMIV